MDWGKAQALYQQCVGRGLVVVTSDEADGNVHFSDLREAVFGGRPACFIPYEKTMYLNPEGMRQYGDYPGHIHELGHAVWTLLLTPKERWTDYHPEWSRSKAAGVLPNEYAATAVEEGWAEDFVIWYRGDTQPEFAAVSAARMVMVKRAIRRLFEQANG